MSALILYTNEDGQSRALLRIEGPTWVSHEQMEVHTTERYLLSDNQRRHQEAQAADAADEADLTALESGIKRPSKP